MTTTRNCSGCQFFCADVLDWRAGVCARLEPTELQSVGDAMGRRHAAMVWPRTQADATCRGFEIRKPPKIAA